MRLYVIRHGQKASCDPDYDGGPNPPLTDRGERQAARLGGFLADEGLDAVYSSCQLRALQTAARVDRRTDAQWHVWPVFCESAQRRWGDRHPDDREDGAEVAAWRTGVPIERSTETEEREKRYLLSDIHEKFPGAQLSQPFPWPDEWWVPGRGQTHSMGYARVELGVQAVLDRCVDGDRVAVVCHGNSGDKILTTLFDIPRRRQSRRFSFSNTGVTRLDRRDAEQWGIVYTNRTNHLPAELRDSVRVF